MTCKHQTLKIMSLNALGVTAGCLDCDETFDIGAEAVEDKYYHFTHNSPRGVEHDLQLLIHYKLIER